MLNFLITVAMIWLLAHLTQRHLIKEANVLAALLVAFALTLLAPIIHLFLGVITAAVFDQSFDPESWFSQIPIIACSSAIIAYVTIKTNTTSVKPDDDHIEKKM